MDVMSALYSNDDRSEEPNSISVTLRSEFDAYPRTPIWTVPLLVGGRERRLSVKLEGKSPYGSIKGRTALGLVTSVVDRVQPGSELIESTSGNLGAALAIVAAKLDIRFIAVVDERLPMAMRNVMVGAGARVVVADRQSDEEDRLLRRLEVVRSMCSEDPELLWLDQYRNSANPNVHRVWTGPEMIDQTPDAEAYFVATSTGGTLRGIADAVRASSSSARVIGVDVEGSCVFGTKAGPRILTGIGAGRRSSFVGPEDIDEYRLVSSWAAAELCREWALASGIQFGGSTGATVLAALQYLEENPAIEHVVCLSADFGDHYADTIFDEQWAGDNLSFGLSRPAWRILASGKVSP